MKAVKSIGPTPAHHDVAQRAYSLWERHGRPPGRDQEFWLLAEAELRKSAVEVEVIPAAPVSAAAPDKEKARVSAKAQREDRAPSPPPPSPSSVLPARPSTPARTTKKAKKR